MLHTLFFSFNVIYIVLLCSVEHCCLVNLGDDNNNTDTVFLWPRQIIDTCSEGEKSMTTLEFLDDKRKIKVQHAHLPKFYTSIQTLPY
jgi:hypothetical protein